MPTTRLAVNIHSPAPRWAGQIVLLFVLFQLAAVSVFGQAVFGNIAGNITDAAGAVVPVTVR